MDEEEDAGAAQKTEPDFEGALNALEALVKQMESGELGLEESLAAFERGVKLTRQCQAALKQAELRVRVLTKDGGFEELKAES